MGLIRLMGDLHVGVTGMKSTDGNAFVGNERDRFKPHHRDPYAASVQGRHVNIKYFPKDELSSQRWEAGMWRRGWLSSRCSRRRVRWGRRGAERGLHYPWAALTSDRQGVGGCLSLNLRYFLQ